MKVKTIMVASLMVMIGCMGTVSAEEFNVGTTYESVDMLLSTDIWNEYLITADSSKKIDYSFAVQGNGTITVFMVKGHNVNIYSDYFTFYSQDTPVKSYSNTFPISSDDGTEFTICIMTEGTENVTYSAQIKVYDRPITDFLFGLIIIIIIIVVIAAIGAAWRSRRRRGATKVEMPQKVSPTVAKQAPQKVQPKRPPSARPATKRPPATQPPASKPPGSPKK